MNDSSPAAGFRIEALETERVSDAVTRRVARGARLEFIAYEYAAGARFARHEHPSEQLTIVLEGTLVFVFDDAEARLDAGDAILIPAGRPHGAYVPGDAGTTRTHNVFTPPRDELPGG